MATMTLRMSKADAEVAKRFAAFQGKSFSDFARDTIFEKIEDTCDLQGLLDAVAEDPGERYSHAPVLAELGL
ncbi:type II toxin-antitoxin system RelB family antitoxin [Curtanaerobium respiraculi]|uniref:type II toxin-antitoxin system RelB family antitoxin n=1 Tax=Curtanaerobium respiraculi TaxID=2949669 RepID=UPI0024B37644|nr:DUF6290 family protein [Curtanaerobium respiraculi]